MTVLQKIQAHSLILSLANIAIRKKHGCFNSNYLNPIVLKDKLFLTADCNKEEQY